VWDTNQPNTIKAVFFKTKNGVVHKARREYTWHIPKGLREDAIKKGDVVLVQAKEKGRAKVIVTDVYREELEDTGKKYKLVTKKLLDFQFPTE